MRIWIDLANSPHVPFFRPLAKEFNKRGHEVVFTARAFAETVKLAEAAGLEYEVIGRHGGRKLFGKAGNLIGRSWALARWARGRRFDLAVSHNSYSQILAACALSLRSVTLMDYEHQPANHLAFRLASRVIVPSAFPEESFARYGARASKVKRYNGTKEECYLADFQTDPEFEGELRELGIQRDDVLVTVRPPADEALYHRFENELFEKLLDHLLAKSSVKALLLPRNSSQRNYYAQRATPNLIVLPKPLDGANLIAHSDLVVSAGGTMNREAAALGIPAASIYRGKWAAIDERLVMEGRLMRIATLEDLQVLPIEKKVAGAPRPAVNVTAEIANLIIES